jgi:hypothetical protein
MDIHSKGKKLIGGVRYDPYFDRYNSVILLSDPRLPGEPFLQHKTCMELIPVPLDRVPPRVCPKCKADCEKEAKEIEVYEQYGEILGIDAPSKMLNSREDFGLPPLKRDEGA